MDRSVLDLPDPVHPPDDVELLDQELIEDDKRSHGEEVVPFDTDDLLPDGPISEIIMAPQCLTPRAKALEVYNLIISWDTEYVEREVDGKRYNEILSYQFSALHRKTRNDDWRYAEGILYTPGPKTPTVRTVFQRGSRMRVSIL